MKKPVNDSGAYPDMASVPDNMIGELLSGEIHTQTMPSARHALASTVLTSLITGAFDRGSTDGPGGWWIMAKPECHLDPDIVVPDIVGWRQSTLPVLPDTDWIDVCPDWICEVLSPETAQNDRILKRNLYAREGVGHNWIVNPIERILEAYALQDGYWTLIATLQDDNRSAVKPFDQIPFDLGRLWA